MELENLNGYETFEDKGIGVHPEGYKKINVHFVFDVKHDLRYHAHLVAGGHMTDPSDSAYSGVIQLRTMRLALLAAELNELQIMVGDVGNAYLEAYTKEKVYKVEGSGSGDLEGYSLVISKALYGL